MQPEIKASIIGVTGYTGLELLRLLAVHPHVTPAHITSRQYAGKAIGDIYPHLSHLDHTITDANTDRIADESDIVFLCLPHKTAQDIVAQLHGRVKVIDLSADYRLKDPDTYARYYGIPHEHPALLADAVYGLPEITDKHLIAQADTVANPGCFAALIQLMLYPFKDYIDTVQVMAVTGSSGSGKTPGDGTHHAIRSHNMKSYKINAHRHIPEILASSGLSEDRLSFVPTSGPFVRGIFATAFVTLGKPHVVQTAYADELFIRRQESVELAHIVGSNFCDLQHIYTSDHTVIVQGALDNLIKGAAGNAVQNMNLMFALEEGTGLVDICPVYP